MNKRPRRLSTKRVVTKTYFEYGVTPAVNKTAAGNYVNFVLGVVLVVGIYLIAGAFGI
jgi:hypothetical protein